MCYKIRAAAFRIPLVRISHDLKEKFDFSSRDYIQGWRKPLHIPYLAGQGINVPWVAHNFWLLVKENDEGQEEAIEAAHAFASELKVRADGTRVAQALPVGRVNDLLMVHFLKKPKEKERLHWLEADPEDSIVVYGANPGEDDTLRRWYRIKVARAVLNSYKVHYSAFGLGWSLGFAGPILNSNSGYRTLGMLMELPIYQFKHWQPGVENTMIPEEDVKHLIEVLKEQETSSPGREVLGRQDWLEPVETEL